MSVWEASYSLVCVAGVRKGREGNLGARLRAFRASRVAGIPFLFPFKQRTKLTAKTVDEDPASCKRWKKKRKKRSNQPKYN